MKWIQINEASIPYWGAAALNFKEKHQTTLEWVRVNVPRKYWEDAVRWIEKHYQIGPDDRIDLLDE